MRAFIEAGGNRREELMDAGSRTEHPGMTGFEAERRGLRWESAS